MSASSRSGSPRWVPAALRIRKAAPRLAGRLPTLRQDFFRLSPLGGATRPSRGAEPCRRDWLRSQTAQAVFPQWRLRAWALAASRRQALVARSSVPARSPVGAAHGAARQGDSHSLSPLLAAAPALVAGAGLAATSMAALRRWAAAPVPVSVQPLREAAARTEVGAPVPTRARFRHGPRVRQRVPPARMRRAPAHRAHLAAR
jgi:hypothetical protein